MRREKRAAQRTKEKIGSVAEECRMLMAGGWPNVENQNDRGNRAMVCSTEALRREGKTNLRLCCRRVGKEAMLDCVAERQQGGSMRKRLRQLLLEGSMIGLVD